MSAFRQVLRRSSGLQDLCCGRSLLSLDSGLLGALPAACQQNKSIASSSACNAPIHIEDELYCRQRQLLVLGNRVPVLAPDSWVAPNAVVIGDVDIFDQVSIWYGAVLRGDLNNIRVGAYSNIQDKSIIHAARTSPTGLPAATKIGRYVTIGQGCLLRSATVENECIIGDRSILMEGSLVEKQSVLAPGTVLPPGRLVPSGQLWAGNPARYVRDLTKDEKEEISAIAMGVFGTIDKHSSEFLPYSFAYVETEKVRKASEP
ncbi:Gamma carbonic anhydrase-like 1, mitochondrial [Coccomyxa sp. Obi]|nr:Gamma carbonic anhydrase-like 1, mitochondrial [Coccomyxa sp. Obi]